MGINKESLSNAGKLRHGPSIVQSKTDGGGLSLST